MSELDTVTEMRGGEMSVDLSALPKLSEVKERVAEWLIPGYIPRGQITSLAGDGGSGKTFIWCEIAAAVSRGELPDLLSDVPFSEKDPRNKVLFISAEDDVSIVLKKRLKAAGAVEDNIICIPSSHELFRRIDFADKDGVLEGIIKELQPALCVFDPIQAFIPIHYRMIDQNAMRKCLEPLVRYGALYGTAFMIIVHSNKKLGVYGRNRLSGSADIWDISRSVLVVGNTGDDNIRYLSHEKCNYGRTQKTVLYEIDGDRIRRVGTSEKKDADYVRLNAQNTTRPSPARDAAKEKIIEILREHGGKMEMSKLDAACDAAGVSVRTLKRAKEDLKSSGVIATWSIGFQPKLWMIRLKE